MTRARIGQSVGGERRHFAAKVVGVHLGGLVDLEYTDRDVASRARLVPHFDRNKQPGPAPSGSWQMIE
jgi:hypothetical protein